MPTQRELQRASAETIQHRLNALGVNLIMTPTGRLVHPDQAVMPEWSEAGGRVTSDPATASRGPTAEDGWLVRTRHAAPLTWLFLQLRDAFGGWLEGDRKGGFYAALAQSAHRHLAANQPEPDDARPLLRVVLAEGLRWLEFLRKDGKLPSVPPRLE
jgi:hypothetical protein